MTTHPTGGASGAPDTRRPELVEFLLARIAEDEESARAAKHVGNSPTWDAQRYRVVVDGEFEVADASVPAAQHIARHDPARVLAECEAKRRIVEAYDAGNPGDQWTSSLTLEWVLEVLALPYADHPDYREEWKP